jgi:PPOX class probable F420-dependent enzyme
LSDAERLPTRVLDFLSRPRFATIATIDADGSPHQAVIWYRLRDGGLVVNSMRGRRWPGNLQRDPRFSLVVEDGLDYVSLAGTAEEVLDPEQAQADIAEMARRYEPAQKAEEMIANRFSSQQRVSFLLRPTRINEHWEG